MKQHDASSADELLEMAEKQASGGARPSLRLREGLQVWLPSPGGVLQFLGGQKCGSHFRVQLSPDTACNLETIAGCRSGPLLPAGGAARRAGGAGGSSAAGGAAAGARPQVRPNAQCGELGSGQRWHALAFRQAGLLAGAGVRVWRLGSGGTCAPPSIPAISWLARHITCPSAYQPVTCCPAPPPAGGGARRRGACERRWSRSCLTWPWEAASLMCA